MKASWKKDRNARFGWISIAAGVLLGLALGLFSFDGPLAAPETLRDYGGLPRRLLRLSHIAFIALGALNVIYAREPGPGGIYLLAIRSGRTPQKTLDSSRGHRRASFVTGKAREGGGLAEPAVDRVQRSRGRKAPARPATQDREGVFRTGPGGKLLLAGSALLPPALALAAFFPAVRFAVGPPAVLVALGCVLIASGNLREKGALS